MNDISERAYIAIDGIQRHIDTGHHDLAKLTSRDEWLKARTISLIDEMHKLITKKDWRDFKYMAKRFAEELHYAVTEWDKYYPKNDKDTE